MQNNFPSSGDLAVHNIDTKHTRSYYIYSAVCLLSDFIPTYSFCSYPPFMALNGL